MNLIQQYLRPHITSIALAIVATLLVIYGNDINRFVKKHIRSFPFLARVGIFFLICALGYGYVTVLLARALRNVFAGMSNPQLLLSVIGSFLLLGFLADHKRHL